MDVMRYICINKYFGRFWVSDSLSCLMFINYGFFILYKG